MVVNGRVIKLKHTPREVVVITEKHCKKCDTIKDVSEFNKNKRSIDLYAHYCANCYKVILRAQYQKTKLKMFTKSLKK